MVGVVSPVVLVILIYMTLVLIYVFDFCIVLPLRGSFFQLYFISAVLYRVEPAMYFTFLH